MKLGNPKGVGEVGPHFFLWNAFLGLIFGTWDQFSDWSSAPRHINLYHEIFYIFYIVSKLVYAKC